MNELLIPLRGTITGPDGKRYASAVHGKEESGQWYGWIVHTPAGGGPPIRTDYETTQSTREALEYWAVGLEPVYLEGSIERALDRGEARASV